MKAQRGRPTTKAGQRCIKLCKPADKALAAAAKRFGWTATATVERSILFATGHKDFGIQVKEVA